MQWDSLRAVEVNAVYVTVVYYQTETGAGPDSRSKFGTASQQRDDEQEEIESLARQGV